jgi:hypothetical protein
MRGNKSHKGDDNSARHDGTSSGLKTCSAAVTRSINMADKRVGCGPIISCGVKSVSRGHSFGILCRHRRNIPPYVNKQTERQLEEAMWTINRNQGIVHRGCLPQSRLPTWYCLCTSLMLMPIKCQCHGKAPAPAEAWELVESGRLLLEEDKPKYEGQYTVLLRFSNFNACYTKINRIPHGPLALLVAAPSTACTLTAKALLQY